jgi:quinoprotein glucose dehydrogenase
MPSLGLVDLDEQELAWLLAYIANPAAASEARAAASLPQEPAGPTPPLPNGESRRYYVGATLNGGLGGGLRGLPPIRPPYAQIVAFDLNEGTVKWRSQLGVIPELAARGITDTGSWHPDRNGITVTAGGLIFMGTLGDAYVRAFDKDNGKVLWEKKMESNPEGIPAIYEVDGRQYVAFFLHTNGEPSLAGPGKPEAQGYYAFALPRSTKP